MNLRVKSLRRTYLISVPAEANLTVVKSLLPETEWTNKQFLFQGKALSEATALSSLGVGQEGELLIVSSCSPIDQPVVFLKHMNYRFYHKYHAATTIADLRQVCSTLIHYDITYLHLSLQDEILPDHLLVSTLGFQPTLEVVTSKRPYRRIEGNYQMFIKELTGKTHCLHVDYSTTFGEIKDMIAVKEGLEPLTLRIIFAGKDMRDESTIASSGAGKESTFHAVRRYR